MASIIKRKKGNNYYYYVVECQRVNGKPRIVKQIYLGTIKRILQKFEQPLARPDVPEEVDHKDFGSIASLLSIAEKIGLAKIIDQHSKKRKQGISVGSYLLLGALNRAISPQSKSGIAAWYEETILPRILKIPTSLIDGKNFWDNMGYLSKEEIEAIELDISKVLIDRFHLRLECLLYDTTNFFTFIDSVTKSILAKRGHSKAHRGDLKQVNLALLVSKDFKVPLFHLLYEGNKNDLSLFPTVTEELVKRYKLFSQNCEKITLVFDKGNNSEKNIKRVDESSYSFIGSLRPSRQKELLSISLDRYENIEDYQALRLKKEVFEKTRTIVITYNESLYRKKLIRLRKIIEKKKAELRDFKKKLNQGKWTKKARIEKKIRSILNSKESKGLIDCKVKKRKGVFTLSVRKNQRAFQLKKMSFGKTILFTDNHSWSTKGIVDTYRGKANIEDDFKRMNSTLISFTPIYHWTDQKIRVHAFMCVLALLLLNLLERELSMKGLKLSLSKIMHQLERIKEIVLFYPKRMEVVKKISRRSEVQQRIYDILNLRRYAPNEK